jgi:hypothetical protein
LAETLGGPAHYRSLFGEHLLDRSVPSEDDLHMSLESIQKEIFQLDSQERAMLIDLLWESLDEARIKEIENKCASESE